MGDKNDMEERRSKQFWTYDSVKGDVVFVTAYECKDAVGYWWVPCLGYSMKEGFSLFDTKLEAINKAISEETMALENAQMRLRRLWGAE